MLDVQALGYVTGGCSCGISDSLKPSRVRVTNRGKVIKRRDPNPCEEGKALSKRQKSEGCGFES